MCDPISIGSLALTAGSTVLSSMASNKVAKARNNANAAEQVRQAQLQRQSLANFDQTKADFTREKQDQKLADAAASRAADLTANIAPVTATSAIPLAGSAPKVVKEDLGKQLSAAIGKGKDYAKRLGALGAFGETQFGNNLALEHGAQTTQRLANFSAGSSRVLPLELNAANSVGGRLQGLADITGALGSIGSVASAAGFNPWAGGAVKPAANGMLGHI